MKAGKSYEDMQNEMQQIFKLAHVKGMESGKLTKEHQADVTKLSIFPNKAIVGFVKDGETKIVNIIVLDSELPFSKCPIVQAAS